MVKAARVVGCLIGSVVVCAQAAQGDELKRKNPTPQELVKFLSAVQSLETGLLESFPRSADPTLKNVAFTYDVAMSALVFARQGKLAASANALKTYRQMPLPAPDRASFNTAYQTQTGRPTLEYRLHGGPLYWTAIALMRYGQAASRPADVQRGVQLVEWVKDHFDHFSGGVVMGIQEPWSYLTSVENNWVYYAALRVAAASLPEGPRRQALEEERHRVRLWIERHVRQRGDSDATKALDVYTHALLVGPEAHLEDFPSDRAQLAVWAKAWVEEIETLFLVPDTARYDYTDARGAAQAGRARMGWLEGTEQVVVAYLTWVPFFREMGDEAFADQLLVRASLAHSEVLDYAVHYSFGWGIPNTDAAEPLPTFSDGWPARPRSEPALNGTNWAYLASVGYNPFTMRIPAPEPAHELPPMPLPRPSLMPLLASMRE